MFIATAITDQSKLRRSETKAAIYIALRSCKRKRMVIYKHFIPTGFMCPRNLLKKQEVRPLLYSDLLDSIGGLCNPPLNLRPRVRRPRAYPPGPAMRSSLLRAIVRPRPFASACPH